VQREQRFLFDRHQFRVLGPLDVNRAEAYYFEAVAVCTSEGWPFSSIRVKLEGKTPVSVISLTFDGRGWKAARGSIGSTSPDFPHWVRDRTLKVSFVFADLDHPERYQVVKLGTSGIRTRYRLPWISAALLGGIAEQRAELLRPYQDQGISVEI